MQEYFDEEEDYSSDDDEVIESANHMDMPWSDEDWDSIEDLERDEYNNSVKNK